MPVSPQDLDITVRSPNPLVWVSAVRLALRRAGVAHEEIEQFTRVAFDQGAGDAMREVCNRWAAVHYQPAER
jgi:hypothetical protein